MRSVEATTPYLPILLARCRQPRPVEIGILGGDSPEDLHIERSPWAEVHRPFHGLYAGGGRECLSSGTTDLNIAASKFWDMPLQPLRAHRVGLKRREGIP
jgi:hypothetical protein